MQELTDINDWPQADEIFVRLAEKSLNAVFALQNDNFSFVNDQFQAYLGYPAEYLLGRDWLDFVHPDDRKTIRREMAERLKDRDSSPFECCFVAASGEPRWALVTAAKVEYEDRQVLLVNLTDISAQKDSEQRLRLFERLANEISESSDADTALNRVLHVVCELTGWVIGEAWIVSDEGDLKYQVAWRRASRNGRSRRDGSEEEGARLSEGIGIPGLAWAYKRPIWVEDIQTSPTFQRARLSGKAGLHTALAAPVMSAAEVVGVLIFYLPETRPADTRFVNLVSAVTGQIGAVIRQKQAQDALRESEEWIRLTLDCAHEAFVAIDDSGRIVEWNRRAEELFGWSKAEILGLALAETIIPPSYRNAHLAGIEHYKATREATVFGKQLRLSALHRDGHEFSVELSISPVRYRQVMTFSAFIHEVNDAAGPLDAADKEIKTEPARSTRLRATRLKKAS